MSEGSIDTRCPACQQPVFDGCLVVRCGRCEALHHGPCWEKRRSCAARRSCRGKPQPVVVVRLPATVDAAELSAVAGRAAADHVAAEALPRVEALVESRATAEGLTAASKAFSTRIDALEESVSALVRDEVSQLREEFARLRAQVESATATVRALGAPGAALSNSVTEALEGVLDERFAALEQKGNDLLADVQSGIETTVAGLHEKLDDTHFAVDRVRRPFPWEASDADATSSRSSP